MLQQSTRLGWPAIFRPRPVLWLAVASFGMITCANLAPLFAQEPAMRVLTVTGAGSEDVQTTITRVSMGVEVQAETAAAAQAEAARRSSSVVELLRSRSVDKLETTGVQLNPVYDYSRDQPRITGYSAVNLVSFRVSTEQAGKLLDELVNAGATRIDSLQFIAEDAALAAAEQVALQEATQDAQAQANAVLGTLNFTAREIVGIQINQAAPPIPLPYAAEARLAADSQTQTPVVGGEQTVRATVTLQIRY
ncbi:MAG: SIMPL domain-containing protein [Leptolyngbyaceae cyanobacterium SM1_1_3]|nr:SIMPL domain-containing protein [Leptolyngbyaceae cyanobacterium SM1_1_3]NJN03747.1 SIMPL domain-containing protein [Leptolyngbyaceae cyanobacterium RM1_1_2]NJO08534.1 SIMPL domain-containing protein [Leptolyngbyaceae cyanobacterium SL_1_1]